MFFFVQVREVHNVLRFVVRMKDFCMNDSMFKRLIICKIYHQLPQIEDIQITYGYATNVTSNIPCKTHNNYIRFLLF